MLDERFHEEIDACRPGSRDIDEPEMSQLADAITHDAAVRSRYEAVQRLDARLIETFAQVPVPAGLAARLIAGLASASAPVTATQQTAVAGSATTATAISEAAISEAAISEAAIPEAAISEAAISEAAIPEATMPATSAAAEVAVLPWAGPRRWITRRRSLAALAASLLVATGLWSVLRSPVGPAESEMSSEAVLWYERLTDQWQPVAEAPADLPLPAAIVGKPRGWQALAKTINRHAVVYRLAGGAQARAVLFVLSARRPGLPAAAPLTPQSATGGLTIGAWQSQGLVYVLVVEGDERAYRRFLPPGRQPLA